MYVAELDRPWTDTPFVYQGFLLEREEQLRVLKKFCRTVTVDVDRGTAPDAPAQAAPSPAAAPVEVREEFPRARRFYQDAQRVVQDLHSALNVGQTLEPQRIQRAIDSMTLSVLRNPDALVLFSKLREKGDYTQSHALDVAVYMISFGHFLELPESTLTLLGYVGLMQDIGKLRVPKAILDKPGRLSPVEMELAKKHVEHSADIVRGTPGLPAELPELVALHHERQDGSGYPKAMHGKDIGLIGSIAAIADVFDALTARRPYAQPLSPSAALSMLYKWRGVHFDASLVEQFIRCVGIFPVGSVVELNSGEVGIVIAQNLEKRLQPRVMVIQDAAGNPMRPQKLLDLSREPKASADEVYRIRRTLEYGSVAATADSLFLK